MFRKYHLCLFASLFYLYAIPVSCPQWVEHETFFQVTPFTESIYVRFFYIARLDTIVRTIQMLEEMKNESKIYFSTPQLSPSDFQHSAVRKCVIEINTEKNLSSFYILWRNFSHFKWVNNDDPTFEIVELTTCLLKPIARQIQKNDQNLTTIFSETNAAEKISISKKISILHNIQNYLIHENYNKFSDKKRVKPALCYIIDESCENSAELFDEVSVQAVLLRFYLLNRLRPIFKQIEGGNDTFFGEIEKYIDYSKITILENTIEFRHPIIQACLRETLTTKKINPTLELIEKFRQFDFIYDIAFTKELISMLIILNSIKIIRIVGGSVLPPSLTSELNRWSMQLEKRNVQALLSILDYTHEKVLSTNNQLI